MKRKSSLVVVAGICCCLCFVAGVLTEIQHQVQLSKEAQVIILPSELDPTLRLMLAKKEHPDLTKAQQDKLVESYERDCERYAAGELK